VPDGAVDWTLERFLERMDTWIERESPSYGLRLVVLDWIMSRHDNPYRGMRRERHFANLWFGPVPGTEFDGTVIVCSYWIEESTRTLTCYDICTLNNPP
jgi:hypothetical protein